MTDAETVFLERIRRGVYEITDDGVVMRRRKGHGGSHHRRWVDVAPTPVGHYNQGGYLIHGFTEDRRKYSVILHRIVYLALMGPIPDGYQINHVNGIRDDNRPANLDVVTPRQNIRHSVDNLGSYVGEGNANVKLTTEQVAHVRELAISGVSNAEIARRFGVKTPCIWKIVSGRTWRHVS